MSEETNEIVPNIDPIDVKEYTQENGTKSDKTCDSGIETNEACSDTFPASSDSETSPVNSISNYKTEVKTSNVNLDHVKQSRDNDSLQDSITSSPVSSYPEDVRTSESPSSEGSPFKNDDFTKEFEVTNDIGASNRELDIYIPDKQRQINPKLDTTSFDYFDKNKTTNVHKSLHVTLDQSSTMDNLAASSVSLDAQDPAEKPLSKSPFSRSAENISHVETALQTFSVSNDKDLDKDEILSQFSMQKKQANATQRIPDTPSTLDVRYTQIPKDILSQDIGNIVKNVHGMFSSVSGSLKYYTHRTVQKQVKNIKTIPNGKVMTDIFEDEMNEAIPIPKEEEIISNPVENNERNSSEHVKDTNQDLDPKSEVQRLQIESLERLLFEQRKENATLKERVKQQADDLENKDQTFKDLEGKLDLMSKRIDEAEREKDAAVMRYASVECAAIEARRAADAAAGAERAARAELLLVQHKLKGAHADKERIIHIYTDKDHKLQNTERELSKVREELKELEGRLKWTQSKLRMEMEAYKESSERADKLSQQVSELEAGREAAAANATDSIKAKQFEAELKECRAALILCRHEREHLDRNLAAVTHQLDACTKERDAATCSLALATAQVEQLKISNLRLEEEAAELAALRAKAALADTLSSQLERESERAHRAETALAAERAAGATCARREAAALAHAARLTATHVSHRADTDSRLDKAQALSVDNAALRERVTSLEAECTKLRAALTEETDRRNHENRVLARKVAELTEEVADANKKLEWEKGENGVLKKKHASAIKELNRELQRALKRCEQLEAKLPTDAPSTTTGSVTSLSSGEGLPQDETLQNGHAETLPDIQVREPDRQALIERIVSLQRAAARRSERCEFLEEHTKQLTEELRKKSRLLRQLLCSMPTGAVSSENRDLNKKQIASAGGGAMAAVWGGDPAGMTLQLSIEMNTKLQALLEDTLLNNITLKNNIDTLGGEISRLKTQKSDTK